MKLVVGLGNPGKKYANTRHNIGFMVVDHLLEEISTNNISNFSKWNAYLSEVHYGGEKLLIVKPLTYMNLSGEAIRPILDFYKMSVDDLIVVYDDLDLPLGKLRFREKGSAGGHNGIKSIIQHIGTDQFKRIKVGIDRPVERTIVDYVLSTFTSEEAAIMNQSIETATLALKDWLKGETFLKLMNKYQ